MLFGLIDFSRAESVTLLWYYEKLSEIKSNPQYKQIIEECIVKAESYLSIPPVVVTNKKWSFNNDFHYYATMAGYWWPEERNGKIVYVNRDGKRNPEANDLDLRKTKKLAERLQYLSLAFFLLINGST